MKTEFYPKYSRSTKLVDSDGSAESILNVCRDILPDWSLVQLSEVKVMSVSGGISNLLYKAENQKSGRSVLVRVYGENSDLMINREKEIQVLSFLSDRGFGAHILGLFGNGRLEEFLDCRPLEVEEIRHPDLAPRIAQKLADLHNQSFETSPHPELFDVLKDYLSKAENIQFPNKEMERRLNEVDLAAVREAILKAEKECACIGSPTVLCHNDLLSGNILLLKEPGKNESLLETPITFIDFEYCAYSYRGYDIANHFHEYQGFELDKTKFPTQEEQKRFVESYLKHSEGRGNVADNPTVEQLLQEVEFFVPLPTAYWGLWAVIQARYSTIDFDFLDYAVRLLNSFLESFMKRKIITDEENSSH